MTQRIYISKLIGDGLTPQTAFRPAWQDIIGNEVAVSQAIDSQKHMFWIGTLDTTTAQHDLLVADNRVRNFPAGLLNKTVAELTAGQKTAIVEVLNYLNLRTNMFSNNAKVKDVLIYLAGRVCWNPVKIAVEAIG